MDILRKNQEISSDFSGEDLYGQMNRTQDIVAVMPIIVRLSYLGFDRINNPNSQYRAGSETMDTSELYARGLRRRKKLFGDADVEKRMAAAGEFGAPLQNIINAYVYGDIWERTGLSNDIRSLVMLGITAASNKPAEFRVHAKGALANGCTKEQVQDVLLLVAMYCGIPAAIETNRIAAEVFGAVEAPGPAAKP
jgi:4-carboxymuconolactone decarboxylase